jgi:hypothetical protein
MKLEEIFKDQPELLQEPAVIKLVDYVQQQHRHNAEICQRHQKFFNDVFDVAMYSEITVIGGTPCEKSMKQIAELIQKHFS